MEDHNSINLGGPFLLSPPFYDSVHTSLHPRLASWEEKGK